MLAAKNKQFQPHNIQLSPQVLSIQKGVPDYIQGRSLLLKQGLPIQPIH